MSITPVTSTPQAGLATDSQARAGERQNVGKQLRQVLSEQRDSMTRMLSQARQQADESTKASARQRLNLLKEQVKLMRTLMAGLPPKQQKAMAAQLKQMAQELKQVLNKCLKERERKIVCACFGIDETEKGLEEIGDKMGLTRERVRQIREKSITKLRESGKIGILMKYLG